MLWCSIQDIRRRKSAMVMNALAAGWGERYGYRRMQAVELLTSWGAKVQFEMSGDFCLTWK